MYVFNSGKDTNLRNIKNKMKLKVLKQSEFEKKTL